MQIKITQEIPCQYVIEVLQEYQNPIKVTIVSSLGGMAVVKTKRVKYKQFCYVPKEEKMN